MTDLTTTIELRIRAGELCIGDRIIVKRNPNHYVDVHTIELGDMCNGLHLNVKRPDHFITEKGKKVPNPMRDAILSSDGCWDRCAYVFVIREQLQRTET